MCRQAVLDLDLDFFAEMISERSRDNGADLPVLQPFEDVKQFLEEQCGLATSSPIPGRIVERHHEVVDLWRVLQKTGRLEAQFQVYHIDAHADLGEDGWTGPLSLRRYISESVLSLDVAERMSAHVVERMDETNFLVFAAAARMFARLVYVTHPMWHECDLPKEFVRWNEGRPDRIQLARYDSEVLNHLSQYDAVEEIPTLSDEPPIPMTAIRCSEFRTEQEFAVATLSLSPGYACQDRADLNALFREYIRLI